ncbi:MAG: hypothetical protein CMN76_11210 [Spirochaetaceae bacterium]|nr:hypothetical protein [Spirochaetaceae bacterium]
MRRVVKLVQHRTFVGLVAVLLQHPAVLRFGGCSYRAGSGNLAMAKPGRISPAQEAEFHYR